MSVCRLGCQFDHVQLEIDKFLESKGSRFRAQSQYNFEVLAVKQVNIILRPS